MKKKYLIMLIIFICLALIAFFFPKGAGSSCGFCPGPPSIQVTEYGCIGFRAHLKPIIPCMDCGPSIVCFGWVTPEKRCYTRVDGKAVEVPGCKNPTTSEEVLGMCPKCLFFAAKTALYPEEDLPKAIEICSSATAGKERDNCLMELISFSSSIQIQGYGERICTAMSMEGMEGCKSRLAQEIALYDIDKALQTCGGLESGRDNCYHNIAMTVRASNETRALEICDMIKEDTSSPPCKELIQKWCEIYSC